MSWLLGFVATTLLAWVFYWMGQTFTRKGERQFAISSSLASISFGFASAVAVVGLNAQLTQSSQIGTWIFRCIITVSLLILVVGNIALILKNKRNKALPKEADIPSNPGCTCKEKGFTLIEVLIVMTVIFLIGCVMVALVQKCQTDQKTEGVSVSVKVGNEDLEIVDFPKGHAIISIWYDRVLACECVATMQPRKEGQQDRYIKWKLQGGKLVPTKREYREGKE